MTATSGADQPTLRDQLAETLHEALIAFSRGEVPAELDLFTHYADALLPLIEADRERAKAEGGAEALERAARDFDVHGLMFDASVPDLLRARAAALRGSTGGGTA